MPPGLLVSHLHTRYGAFAALNDVSLSLRDGEVLGLIGPNGAGKTTLFECVAGVLPADSGTVTVGGRAAVFLPSRPHPVDPSTDPNSEVAQAVASGAAFLVPHAHRATMRVAHPLARRRVAKAPPPPGA